MLLSDQASVLSKTVAAACTQMKSQLSSFASGSSRSAVLTLTRTCGISRRKMFEAWMSTTQVAPFMSATMREAIASSVVPRELPGKMRFMSRSKPGIPRVIESIPRGLIAG